MKLGSLMALSGPVVLAGACGGGGTDLPTDPPTTVTRVAQGGFRSPTDAVSSPDGSTFYFGGSPDPGSEPAIFRVASSPGATAEAIAMSEPLGLPIGLLLYLVFSGAWANAEVFWWPFTGLGFGDAPHPVWERGWWNVLLEVAGIGMCAWIWRRAGLGVAERRARFVRTGQLLLQT